jgi:hypothetical protein
MYFGSAEKPNREHLRRLKQLVKRTNTLWLSDHLCWGSVDGRYTHDLLPMPYFRRIEHEEYALLSAIRCGKTIERAIELAFQRSSIPEFERPGYVRNCFRTWTTLGWFCRPEKKAERRKIAQGTNVDRHQE